MIKQEAFAEYCEMTKNFDPFQCGSLQPLLYRCGELVRGKAVVRAMRKLGMGKMDRNELRAARGILTEADFEDLMMRLDNRSER